MAHFSTIHTIAFLQKSPKCAEFFQTQLIANGKTAGEARGCARAGDLKRYLDHADARTGFAVLVPTAADALRLASPGEAPRVTLNQWSEELRALFDVAARHRTRVCLLLLSSAANSLAAALAAIAAQFDLNLPALAAQEPVALNLPTEPIGRLASHVLATEDATVRRLEARLQAKSAALPSIAPRMDTLLGDVQHQIADRDQRLMEFAQQLVEKGDELDSTLAEVTALAQHIELIRTSTSWRLTGPLRRLRRLFPRS
jgi:hypothetical protein